MTVYRAASALAVALAAAPVSAADAPPSDSSIIVTARRVREAVLKEVRGRPGGTDLVTAEDYENRLATSLRETLAFSPGVYAQPRFGQEIRLSIRGSGISRGFHMRGLTLLQDGIPINLADDNGDFQELDPLIFDHIEVYRGANALRFGGSTLGGAINAVTPTGRTAPGLDLRLDGGGFGTLRGKAAFGAADDAGDAWLALTGDRSDGERAHDRRHSLRFNGNVGLRLGPTVETRFYASAQTIRQELPGALPLDLALSHPETGSFAGDQQRDIDSLRLQNRMRLHVGAADLDVGLFLNAKQLFHPIFQVVDQKSTDYGAYARLDWSKGPFELTLGTTARFGTVASRRYVNLNGRRGALTFDADQAAHTIDVYGEGRFKPTDALTLVAGGIYTNGRRAQDQIFPAPVAASAGYDQFSPKLGLIWEPRADVQIYANYSRSAELPGFIELAQVASFVPLAPQRAWTAEIGARGHIGIARFDISLYRADLRGELLQFNTGPDIPASTFNADRTRHQGIEAGLTLDLAPWARLRQVYQYNDFRFRDDARFGGNRLPVIPKHLYRAELRLGSDAFNVAPAVECLPDGAWADYADHRKVGGYATLGVTAEAELRDGVSLFLDARNLTNEKAVGDITAVVDFDALAPAQQAIFYPIERRAVYGGIRMHF